MGGTIPGLVDLDCIREIVDFKPVNSNPSSLLQVPIVLGFLT